jgi:hypothetical protein
METTILVLLIYMALLFMYDHAVAPSLRSDLSAHLTALLVRQVRLSVEYRDLNAKHDLRLLYESIKSVDSNLHLITLGTLLGVGAECKEDPVFLGKARERARMLDESTVPGIREVFREIVEVATKAVIINGVSRMALFAAPWVLASVGLDALKKRIRVLAVSSDDDFQRVAPRPRVSRSFRRLLRR